MKPFLVSGVSSILRTAQHFAPFELLIRVLPARHKTDRGGLTELWVLGHVFLALVMLLLLPSTPAFWLRIVVMGYGMIRLAEVVVFQSYSQIIGGYPGRLRPSLHYKVSSLRRSILLAGILYLETALWFAVFYRINSSSFTFSGILLSHPLKAFYFSTVTITTLGYGDVSANTNTGFALVIAEVLVGVYMAILVLARVISYLPAPSTMDPEEQSREDDGA